MADQEALIAQRKEELIQYVQSFYRASWNWRSQAYHAKWDKYDRQYHSIYDPEFLARKEPWQSSMFIGVTLTNCELITSEIFKTMASPSPMIETAAGPAGDSLQAELIQDVMEHEIRKARFPVAFHDGVKEAVRYGSGFVKLGWERLVDTRYRRTAMTQSTDSMVDAMSPQNLSGEVPMRSPEIYGYGWQKQEILLKDCLWAKAVHIRDVFPEPNTRDWSKILHRDKWSYGTIVDLAKKGVFFDESDKLEMLQEGEKFDEDLTTSKSERGFVEGQRKLTQYEKRHTIWELWAPVPRKWTKDGFGLPEGDEAETLVPGRIVVASGVALLMADENDRADGEPPIIKMDYVRTGEPYGKGICEMISDEQDEINEIRNLRVDNVNLIINKMIAVFDTAIVSHKDLVSRPGGILRLKSTVTDDIRKVFAEFQFPDITSSAYRETLEIERQIQERTGANRVTMGSSGLIKDTNQTLGGMELLKQMFNERIAAYGMMIEMTFLLQAAEKIYALIYQEVKPDNLRQILGDAPVEIGRDPLGRPVAVPRFMAFAHVPPEELYGSYKFKPMGIFTMENKVVRSAQVMDLIRLFGADPRFNVMSAGEYVATKLQGIDEAAEWFNQVPLMPPPMGAGGPAPAGERPGMKGGPNGNQPSFLPPNPVRRVPVA